MAQDADSATTVIEGCQHLRRSGTPQVQRYGSSLIWLALVPAGTHHSETGPAGSYRIVPLHAADAQATRGAEGLVGYSSNQYAKYYSRDRLTR